MNTFIIRILAFMLFLWVGSSAHAAHLLIDAQQKLYGAQQVNVDGTFYDVLFIDDSCTSLFAPCNAVSDFTFTESGSLLASQALLDQVFIDAPIEGLFDTDPEVTKGCTNPGVCLVVTPFGFNELGRVLAGFANNDQFEASDAANIGVLDTTVDLSIATTAVYAVWSASEVPLPGSLVLFLSSIAFGAFIKRVSA